MPRERQEYVWPETDRPRYVAYKHPRLPVFSDRGPTEKRHRRIMRDVPTLDCEEFVNDPNINPVTGRRIVVDGKTFRHLEKLCDEWLTSIDLPRRRSKSKSPRKSPRRQRSKSKSPRKSPRLRRSRSKSRRGA